MTNAVITNNAGGVFINGEPLEVGACSGVAAPFEITGDGEFHIVCNPDPPTQIGETEIEVAADKENPSETVKMKQPIYQAAPPVSLTLSDALGQIVIVQENTRYPEEGNYLIFRPIQVT